MALVNAIATALRDIETIRFAQLSSSAIIIFDHVITLDGEVELIWKSSWSMGKALFVINRYYTLISVVINNYGLFSHNLSDSFCLRFFQWQGWTGLIACLLAQIILIMRLYALYLCSKRVLAMMVMMFIAAMASSAAIMGVVLHGITARAHLLPGTTFCVPLGVPHWFFAFWIPIMVFESLLCGLALYRGFQAFRASVSLYQSGRRLVTILIRDSVLYFLVMFATYLTSLIVWAVARWTLLEVPIAFSVALSCCLCNRIVLNVREIKSELDEASAARHVQRGTAGASENDAKCGSPGQDSPTHSYHYYAESHSEYPGNQRTPEPLSDIEMAQLRSMRVDQEYVQELESESNAYETGYGHFVVL